MMTPQPVPIFQIIDISKNYCIMGQPKQSAHVNIFILTNKEEIHGGR